MKKKGKSARPAAGAPDPSGAGIWSMRTNEDLFAVIDEYMVPLQRLHAKFADKRPVMQISLPALQIVAFPYLGYLKTLSARSQTMLEEEYRRAVEQNKMVVFVRDEVTRVLKSVPVPIFTVEEPD